MNDIQQPNSDGKPASVERLKVTIRGAVQGVGFRPFVYRLAMELELNGWISNTVQGVFIEVEGVKATLDRFLLRLQNEKPPRSFIQSLEHSYLDPLGFRGFEIRPSNDEGIKTALVLPDIAACSDCLEEIFDSSNRRHLYPFTNCTNCGPRFSIIESLPYDRPNTSMKKFPMCEQCLREYEDPMNRRFHAQPNACPECGPHLELWDSNGKVLATHHTALLASVEAIRQGKIVAVKGLGGFHLMVDALNENAVLILRQRKHREEKPFALMYPSRDAVSNHCLVSELEERLLLSPESPIVLLNRNPQSEIHNSKLAIRNSTFVIPHSEIPIPHFPFRPAKQQRDAQNAHSEIAPSIAPRNPYLGVMLPYTPLHHILMRELYQPIVATSGNLSDEPICIDEREALLRLKGIADAFLIHNRPIVRHVDDSIVRIVLGRELVLRRARGYAPLPVLVESAGAPPIIAVGAHLKNTVALTVGKNTFISQHIGDLETEESYKAFRTVINDFQNMYQAFPEHVACDLHPDYLSSTFARDTGKKVFPVQHHYAHVTSCMAENQLQAPLLGVSWDGTGYGLDGTIWGGEFLLIDQHSFERVATFRSFRLPGGDKAVKEGRRTLLGVFYEMYGEKVFSDEAFTSSLSFTSSELSLLKQMLVKGLNSPRTTSVGRLFDAVAALIGLQHRSSFEGQAAMELEFATALAQSEDSYPFQSIELPPDSPNAKPLLTIDWHPIILAILQDVERGTETGLISARFHNTLAEVIVHVVKTIGQQQVVLTGGCFQNRYLTERVVRRLEAENFSPYWHQRVPPNDGGISLGQALAFYRSSAHIEHELIEPQRKATTV